MAVTAPHASVADPICPSQVLTHPPSDQARQAIHDRITVCETLTLTLVSGGVRTVSSAITKAVTQKLAIHASLFDPMVTSENSAHDDSTKLPICGQGLSRLYKLILAHVETLEASAAAKCIDLSNHPLNVVVKFQSYHLPAKDLADLVRLTAGRSAFCVREPSRTMESSIIVALKVARDLHPDLDIQTILMPGTDTSFINLESMKTPMAQLVEHVTGTRDFSIFSENMSTYLSQYSVLDDPELKLDAWRAYGETSPKVASETAMALGFRNFEHLMNFYKTTPSKEFFRLPKILLEPLQLRRISLNSMMELRPYISGSESGYSVVESTALQLEGEVALQRLFDTLQLPKRDPDSAMPYADFHAGHEQDPVIRRAFYDRVEKFTEIQPPEAKIPLTLDRLPAFLQEQTLQDYAGYVTYLRDSHFLKSDKSPAMLFATPLADGKPASTYHFTSMYALNSVEPDGPQRAAVRSEIRNLHAQYTAYFDMMDTAAGS